MVETIQLSRQGVSIPSVPRRRCEEVRPDGTQVATGATKTAQRTVNHWLDRFATRAGSTPLRLDERGLCAFTYVDRFGIAIKVPEENAAHVYVSGTVMSIVGLDHDEQMALYREMLGLNLFDARARGPVLRSMHPRWRSSSAITIRSPRWMI